MSIAAYQLDNKSHTLCIVVGLGMVGDSISKQFSLRSQAINVEYQQRVDWNNPIALTQTIQSIIKETNAKNIELIWSAGKAGFSATQQQMDSEYNYYSSVIGKLASLADIELTVNMISSAGGIYENSGLINKLDEISPNRPYAISKLQQESLLVDAGIKHRIYRASSVYGIGGSRIGLINNMLKSAYINKPMMIYADQNTLRDYLYYQDLGKYVVNDVIFNQHHGIKIIASGRATSINMLLYLVRNITKKTVPVTFCRSNTNSKDIIFAQHLLTKNTNPTTLEEGIRILNKKMLLAI